MVCWKCSAPPSGKSSRATAVITTCFSRIRCTASATRAGSSVSNGNGLAVVTAQKRQARVQRSPAIMKVAVPRLQHSQWFGHLALSQTVCNRNSSSSARVWANLSVVGRVIRSHGGKRGRVLKSAEFKPGILFLQPSPKFRQLVGTKIGQNLALHIEDRRQILPRKPNHLIVRSLISHDIYLFVIDSVRVQPVHGPVTPPTERVDE